MDMGTEDGKSTARLVRQLERAPEKFEFYQAVRLIQNVFLTDQTSRSPKLLGEDVHLSESMIRFRSKQSLSFEASEVSRIRTESIDEEIQYFDMTVSFFGLTGPTGVLPDHYSSLVIERSHTRNKDYALRDFLDLFNNRAISFFFQSWQKYRLPFIYERNRLGDKQEDPVTTSLISLTGHGGEGLSNRSSFRDEALLFYSGLFANQKRNAISLEQLISSYYGVTAKVIQFCSRWIYLTQTNQSSFPRPDTPEGQNLSLGNDAIIGTKFRDLQSLFRIEIGPLRWVEFLRFLPGMSEMNSLVEMTHRFAGGDLDFEVQLQVRADRVPPMEFSQGSPNPLALGQTTWLGSPDPEKILNDVCFRFGFGGRPFQPQATSQAH
ncbi:MAG: type VI secretion system baseplate subunit TssG [Planctomicrobium sp.]|jgi:type VI secretion system protein ImpH|nr:type VI secretion system baseplate subunit TssG [Planctomicrobium sp.]